MIEPAERYGSTAFSEWMDDRFRLDGGVDVDALQAQRAHRAGIDTSPDSLGQQRFPTV